MKKVSGLLAGLLIVAFVGISFAGPTTNRTEYDGDKKMTPQQHDQYKKNLDAGIQFYENKQYDEAEKEFKAILSYAPHKNLAYFNLGLTKYRQGDYEAAIKYFDQVIKKRSYYVGAAFYYKSISQLNLEKNEDAIKTAKRFTQNRFFYGPSQNLIKAIRNGSDEYLDNARLALQDENYELCLLEMEESVFTDTKKGKELVEKCKVGLANEKAPAPIEIVEKAPNRHKIYLETRLSHSDNVYQEGRDEISKYLYSIEVGGEYIWANKVDFGLGASYEVTNAFDLDNYKDEYYTVYAPFFYRNESHRWSGQAYYSQSKNNDSDAYSTHGGFLNYFYVKPEYSLGVVAGASQRVSLDSNFDYRAGFYSTTRLVANRFIDKVTLGAYVAYDQNLSGDQPFGTNTMPFGYKATRYGANASYAFNQASRVIARANFSHRDYLSIYSANGTDRLDTLSNYSLSYNHTFNKNVSAYIQQSYINNDSTYNQNEFIDKNYTENLTTLGLTLVSY